MKLLFVAVFFVAIGSAEAAGVEKKNAAASATEPKPLALAPAPTPAQSLESVTIQETDSASVQIRLAPSVMVLFGGRSSVSGIGGVASVGLFRSNRLDVGLDFGYFRRDASVNLSMIPIQFSLVRRFSEGPVRPYLGFAVGATILNANDPSSPSDSITLPIPSLALRPGIEVSLTRSLGLFLEARGGLLLALPFLNPQLGVTLAL